jgi:hypothetical protein
MKTFKPFIAYKGMIRILNGNLYCMSKRYEIGKTYKMKARPIVCGRGYHSLLDLLDTTKTFIITLM